MTTAVAKPSGGAYQTITLSANSSLLWPQVSATASRSVAAQIDVTPTASGLSLAMPDARSGNPGPATVIANLGSATFTLTDSNGGTIAAIGAGQAWIISLLTNTAGAGTWRAQRLGALANAVQGASLADGATTQATSAGAALQSFMPTNVVGGNATLLAANRGSLNILSSSAAASQWRVDATANLGAGWWCEITNQSTNQLTLIGSDGEPINGFASITVNGGTSVRLVASSGALTAKGTFLTANAVVSSGGLSANNRTLTALALGTAGQALTNINTHDNPIIAFSPPAPLVTPATPNLVYNGGCRIGARADAGITTNVSGTAQYGQVDLFQLNAGFGTLAGTIVRKSGNNFGSTGYSVQVAGLDPISDVQLTYRMEALDTQDILGNVPFVVQALVLQNTGFDQTCVFQLYRPFTTPDDFSNLVFITSGGQTLTVPSGVPTLVSLIGLQTGIFTPGKGIQIVIKVTGSTPPSAAVTTFGNVSYDFTDIGFFLNTATPVAPFPETPYETDLAHCKRYLPRWFGTMASLPTFSGRATSVNAGIASLPYDIEPRIATTGILTSAASTFGVQDVASGTLSDCTSAPAFSASSKNVLLVTATSAGNLTNARSFFLGSGSTAAAATPSYVLATGAEL